MPLALTAAACFIPTFCFLYSLFSFFEATFSGQDLLKRFVEKQVWRAFFFGRLFPVHKTGWGLANPVLSRTDACCEDFGSIFI